MAKRDTPNVYYAWYNDDDRLAIVYNRVSTEATDTSPQYDTYNDSTVTDGVRIHYKSKYEEIANITDDFKTNAGVDTGLHPCIVDYVKYRMHEDLGDAQMAIYYWKKYQDKVKKYPHRKDGVRRLNVPRI